MCSVCDSNVIHPNEVNRRAREQIMICRHEITLCIAKLKATEPLSPEVALMAEAILEYFGLQVALEAAEAEARNGA